MQKELQDLKINPFPEYNALSEGFDTEHRELIVSPGRLEESGGTLSLSARMHTDINSQMEHQFVGSLQGNMSSGVHSMPSKSVFNHPQPLDSFCHQKSKSIPSSLLVSQQQVQDTIFAQLPFKSHLNSNLTQQLHCKNSIKGKHSTCLPPLSNSMHFIGAIQKSIDALIREQPLCNDTENQPDFTLDSDTLPVLDSQLCETQCSPPSLDPETYEFCFEFSGQESSRCDSKSVGTACVGENAIGQTIEANLPSVSFDTMLEELLDELLKDSKHPPG